MIVQTPCKAARRSLPLPPLTPSSAADLSEVKQAQASLGSPTQLVNQTLGSPSPLVNQTLGSPSLLVNQTLALPGALPWEKVDAHFHCKIHAKMDMGTASERPDLPRDPNLGSPRQPVRQTLGSPTPLVNQTLG